MATTIRPELSLNNKYWIDRHRFYELKHFCLQYKSWKKKYKELNEFGLSSIFSGMPSTNMPADLTAKYAMKKLQYAEMIKMVERAAEEADEYLCDYILKGVTEGLSYTNLKSKLNIPCSRDTYYDRYRKFFWLLSNMRD